MYIENVFNFLTVWFHPSEEENTVEIRDKIFPLVSRAKKIPAGGLEEFAATVSLSQERNELAKTVETNSQILPNIL